MKQDLITIDSITIFQVEPAHFMTWYPLMDPTFKFELFAWPNEKPLLRFGICKNEGLRSALLIRRFKETNIAKQVDKTLDEIYPGAKWIRKGSMIVPYQDETDISKYPRETDPNFYWMNVIVDKLTKNEGNLKMVQSLTRDPDDVPSLDQLRKEKDLEAGFGTLVPNTINSYDYFVYIMTGFFIAYLEKKTNWVLDCFVNYF